MGGLLLNIFITYWLNVCVQGHVVQSSALMSYNSDNKRGVVMGGGQSLVLNQQELEPIRKKWGCRLTTVFPDPSVSSCDIIVSIKSADWQGEKKNLVRLKTRTRNCVHSQWCHTRIRPPLRLSWRTAASPRCPAWTCCRSLPPWASPPLCCHRSLCGHRHTAGCGSGTSPGTKEEKRRMVVHTELIKRSLNCFCSHCGHHNAVSEFNSIEMTALCSFDFDLIVTTVLKQ